jgi:hypothetical protein
MATGRQAHAQDRVTGLQQGEEHRAIGLRARMRWTFGEAAAEQLLGAVDRQCFDRVRGMAALIIATAWITFGIFVGNTEPCASSTARDTMFSEAISSIWVCSRVSSSLTAAATAGSASARLRVKKPCGWTSLRLAAVAMS